MLINHVNPIPGGGGALSATLFLNRPAFVNGCSYCSETSWLFLNMKNKNFEKKFDENFSGGGVAPAPRKKLGPEKIVPRPYVAKHYFLYS